MLLCFEDTNQIPKAEHTHQSQHLFGNNEASEQKHNTIIIANPKDTKAKGITMSRHLRVWPLFLLCVCALLGPPSLSACFPPLPEIECLPCPCPAVGFQCENNVCVKVENLGKSTCLSEKALEGPKMQASKMKKLWKRSPQMEASKRSPKLRASQRTKIAQSQINKASA